MIFLLALAAGCGRGGAEPTPPAAHPEATAPDFTLPLLGGGEVGLSRFRGTPLVLNFWATWCPACRGELPLLERLHREKGGKDFALLTVAIGEPPEKVAEFASQNGLSFPIALDSKATVAARYRVKFIPTTFFIDGAGRIRAVKTGAFASADEFEEYLRQLLR